MSDEQNNRENFQLKENNLINKQKGVQWIVLLSIVIFIGIIYLFNIFLKNKNINNIKQKQSEKIIKTNNAHNLKSSFNQKEIKDNYKIIIDDIKNSFLIIKDKKSNEDLAKFSHNSLKKMFRAIVPLEDKDFHLKLTLKLNTINKLSVLNKVDNIELNKEVDKLNNILEEWK